VICPAGPSVIPLMAAAGTSRAASSASRASGAGVASSRPPEACARPAGEEIGGQDQRPGLIQPQHGGIVAFGGADQEVRTCRAGEVTTLQVFGQRCHQLVQRRQW
jgi:hypothetical protein